MIRKLFFLYYDTSFIITILLFLFLIIFCSRKYFQTGSIVKFLSNDAFWPIFCKSLIGAALANILLYFLIPNFRDYGEAVIPLLAANFLHGGPVYADWYTGGSVVGSNYGPYVFLLQSLALAWFPNLFASKLVGIAFALTALVCFCLTINRCLHSFQPVLVLCALMIVLLSFHLHYWFWNRPDSMLIAIAALGVLIYERSRPSHYLIWLGLLAGFSLNLKLFAPLYLVPLAWVCLMQTGWSSRLIPSLSIGSILFVMAAVLPFSFPAISFAPYIANILLMPKQGLFVTAIIDSFLYGTIIFAAPFMASRVTPFSGADRMMAIALGFSAAVVALLSGKPGGGPPYMMPFVPISLYLAASLWARSPPERQGEAMLLARAVLAAAFIGALPSWSYSWYQMSKQLIDRRIELDKTAELRGLFARFPAAEMGHGDGPGDSSDEYYRVQKAFLGQVTHFDYVNYADQRLAGVPVSVIYPLFDHCSVPSWIFARSGGMFDESLLYYGQPLFDAGLRKRFRANYEPAYQGKYYDVWICKGGSQYMNAAGP